MKANNLTIIPPEGMEAYQEGNEIKFRSIENKVTYENVAKALFEGKDVWRIGDLVINKYNRTGCWNYLTNCGSEKQAKKLYAINLLMNVAKYLNGDWTPNWEDSDEVKCYIHFYNRKYIDIDCSYQYNYCLVYFKTIQLAQQAIEILGEETIKLALSTDW